MKLNDFDRAQIAAAREHDVAMSKGRTIPQQKSEYLKPVSFRLDPETKSKLEILAHRNRRTMSGQLAQLIDDAFEQSK
jgi:hypothetical protein